MGKERADFCGQPNEVSACSLTVKFAHLSKTNSPPPLSGLELSTPKNLNLEKTDCWRALWTTLWRLRQNWGRLVNKSHKTFVFNITLEMKRTCFAGGLHFKIQKWMVCYSRRRGGLSSHHSLINSTFLWPLLKQTIGLMWGEKKMPSNCHKAVTEFSRNLLQAKCWVYNIRTKEKKKRRSRPWWKSPKSKIEIRRC